ncbi:MAG: hypothetical protein H6Q60_611 [Oscillospiraceae bacterium]|nr:hypothetical protein [Oscillospiraceae bacterium]
MTISEKVAYIKGMYDGMALNTETSKEAKLIGAIIDVLEEVGLSIEDLEDTTEVLSEGLDAISEDLEDVEDILYDDEDEEDDCCGHDHGHEDEDEDFFEISCPNCNEELVIDEDILKAGEIQCPGCGQKFTLNFSDECGCGECGCDHDHDEE